jgi:hypothetical protein
MQTVRDQLQHDSWQKFVFQAIVFILTLVFAFYFGKALYLRNRKIPLEKFYVGKHLTFRYPASWSNISPEEFGYRTEDSVEFKTFAYPGATEPLFVVAVKSNKNSIPLDYRRLKEQIQIQYPLLYPRIEVVSIKSTLIGGRSGLKLVMKEKRHRSQTNKVQYVYLTKNYVYWFTFNFQDKKVDNQLIKSIVETVRFK